MNGSLYVCADDEVALRINEQFLGISRLELVAIKFTVSIGDTIIAKATINNYSHGFMLFCQSDDTSRPFSRTLFVWTAYAPADPLKWWNVSPSPDDPGASQGHKHCLTIPESSGYGVDSIWASDKGASFIYHVVSEQELSSNVYLLHVKFSFSWLLQHGQSVAQDRHCFR